MLAQRNTVAQRLAILLLISGVIVGCQESSPPPAKPSAPPVMKADAASQPNVLLPSQLRRMLNANENAQFERVGNDIVGVTLYESGVTSIAPLEGLPLRSLDLGMTDISDLSVLKGMPLTSLILENTPVTDISILKGMQLELLYLQNTKVTDLASLTRMPLQQLNLMNVPVRDLANVAKLPLKTLWIPGTNITDLSALAGKSMESLDIERTSITSIEPLKGMTTLRRLNIANTLVTDVSPLTGLKLDRITLTPQSIENGMEVLRAMPGLTQILTSMEGPPQSAADFWKKFDAGVWKTSLPPPEKTDDAAVVPTNSEGGEE